MMAAVGLAMIGGDDHLVAGLPPARQKGGEHGVHRVDGMVHLVAIVAEPIASISDRVLKTKLVGCVRCNEKRKSLNQSFPFKP